MIVLQYLCSLKIHWTVTYHTFERGQSTTSPLNRKFLTENRKLSHTQTQYFNVHGNVVHEVHIFLIIRYRGGITTHHT